MLIIKETAPKYDILIPSFTSGSSKLVLTLLYHVSPLSDYTEKVMSKYPSRSVPSPSETLRHTGQRNGAKSSVDFMVDTIFRNVAPK